MQFRDRYDILRQIGRGTTASVFLVRDKHLDKRWVAKVFEASLIQEGNASWFIQNEIDVLKRLNFPQMPRAVDLYRESGGIYLVMDYMEGMTLKSFIQQYGTVSETVALTWMQELCQLLELLHKMNPMIIYCDLKPENIVLQKDGKLALVDFGSARIPSQANDRFQFLTGTKGYTAPELFQVEELSKAEQGKLPQTIDKLLTPRTDVYSIGAVGLFMTTGLHPANGPLILSETIREDSLLTKPFRQLILKCMEDREKRFKNSFILSEKIQKIKKEKRD